MTSFWDNWGGDHLAIHWLLMRLEGPPAGASAYFTRIPIAAFKCFFRLFMPVQQVIFSVSQKFLHDLNEKTLLDKNKLACYESANFFPERLDSYV